MGIKTQLFGRREFLSEEKIKQAIRSSEDFDSEKEDPDRARAMLLFQTPRQQTWLVATSERLYIILDDARKPEPDVSWSASREEILAGDEVGIDISASEYRPEVGRVEMGEKHQRWLYSKALFRGTDVEESIKHLVSEAMLERG